MSIVNKTRGRAAVISLLCLLNLLFAMAARAAETLSVTEYSYDTSNRVVCTADRMVVDFYTSMARDACSHGPPGQFGPDRIVKNVYDDAGQLLQVIEGFGLKPAPDSSQPFLRAYATYTYSTSGKVIDVIDANGNKTHMAYDGFDRLSHLYFPAKTRRAYAPTTPESAIASAGAYAADDYEYYDYDANNNRTVWQRRNGKVITSTYDNLNQETVRDLPPIDASDPGTSRDVYTRYDLAGHVVTKRLGSASAAGMTYEYDALGRMRSATDTNGRKLSYEYNPNAARTRLTYPSGRYVTYALDVAGRVNSARLNFSASSNQILYGIAYDHNGNRLQLARLNGAPSISDPSGCALATNRTCYGHDAKGRLTSLQLDFNDNSDNTTKIADVSWTFGYNPVNQVASINAASSVGADKDKLEYRGKRSNTESLQPHDGLNRRSSLVNPTATCPAGGYDLNGNLICDGTGRKFNYDNENRLIKVTGTGLNLDLDYDPEGRLSKYTYNGAPSTFLYDGVNLIGEYNGTGGLITETYFGPGGDEPLIGYNGSTPAVYRLYWANYQGSIIGITAAGGTLIESAVHKYSPYGEPTGYGIDESWTGSRFRYTGQIALPEAQLYYYRARFYDPKLGRFLQTDPIGSEDDLNMYAYVGGDPVNGTDPTGTRELGSYSPTGQYYSPGSRPGGPKTVKEAAGLTLGFAGIIVAPLIAVETGGTALYLAAADPKNQIFLYHLAGAALSSVTGTHSMDVPVPTLTLALGKTIGLKEFAATHGAETYRTLKWSAEGWRGKFLDAMADEGTQALVNLDDVGDVMSAVSRGQMKGSIAMDFEMYSIWANRQWWSRIRWFKNGKQVANPFED